MAQHFKKRGQVRTAMAAKPFYKLQRFLKKVQLLLLFLGVAYIMAGSVLLLQRSKLVLFQSGTDSFRSLPSLPAPPRALGYPVAGWRYRQPGTQRIQDMEKASQGFSGSSMDQRGSDFRNIEKRLLRHHWFHGLMTDTDARMKQNPRRTQTGHKGIYVGCFVDDERDPALGGTVLYDFRKMTGALCQDTCSESGYQFAGLEYGAECHCGNRISAPHAREEDCNLDCKGERGSACGGVGRLSVYRVERPRPGHRRYRNVRYHGCFKGSKSTAAGLSGHAILTRLTAQLCIESCTDEELPFALLRGQDCCCGNASSYSSLQHRVEDHWCGQSNLTDPYLLVHNYFQVYNTPVLDSRCKERTFLPEKSSSLVALTSFPGAGNTWVRHLIEMATGFYTGSFYFDGSLYNKGFKGEKDYWKSGRTICVKTHESGQREMAMFHSAVLLLRNPYRSLMAEFNRKCAGHLGYATASLWNSKEWPEFVESYGSWWASHALNWLRFGGQLLVVHFEELQAHLLPQLRLIAAFLNASAPEERLLCAENNRDGHFKRSGGRRLTFDPFTPDMRARIDGYIRTVDQGLKERNFSGLPEDYMPR